MQCWPICGPTKSARGGGAQTYRGIFAVARDGKLRTFAAHHLANELANLRRIRRWLPGSARSQLLALWHGAGWLTGTIGPRAVFVTVAAVEHFVDRHYVVQIERVPAYPELIGLHESLPACRRDEMAHRDDPLSRLHERLARSREPGRPSLAKVRSWALPPVVASDKSTQPLADGAVAVTLITAAVDRFNRPAGSVASR